MNPDSIPSLWGAANVDVRVETACKWRDIHKVFRDRVLARVEDGGACE